MDLTHERLIELLDYNQTTGNFTWRQNAGRYGRYPAGTIAGSLNSEGYRSICIDGTLYRVSRLAFFCVTGEWPKHQMDHINRNPSDDRWENLREATPSQNKQNNGIRKDNSIGFKCVVHDKERNKYRWQVVVNGKRIKSSKRYNSAEEAYNAYCNKLPEFHGEFASEGAS